MGNNNKKGLCPADYQVHPSFRRASPHPEAREEDDKAYSEADMLALIDERDKAEGMVDSLLDIIGVEHEWSNAYNYSNALDDAQDALARLAAPKPEGQTIEAYQRLVNGGPCGLMERPAEESNGCGVVFDWEKCRGCEAYPKAAPEPRPAEEETK